MSECVALEFEVFAPERSIADRPPVYFDTGSHSRPDLLAVNSLEPALPVVIRWNILRANPWSTTV